MPKIRLRPNVSYGWLGQVREGGGEYDMGEGEAEYVRECGFEFDPDEPTATGEPGAPVPQGRFAIQIAKDLEALADKED